MGTCRSCGAALGDGEAACPVCDSHRSPPSGLPTNTAVPPPIESSPTPGRSSWDRGQLLPGVIVAGRYRVFGIIGRGGMGEVYRADDLKLGQPVALKFLPEEHTRDETRLQRFLAEVRIARQISHPNVCRVYDVGEVDGRHFLSMEYVDGEDLASLLRRIGRLPRDKAVQIARQLCAGLAAAHEQGVLHRDLKPSNVMIDGRGRARITDFGLATVQGQQDGERGEVWTAAGTPAYMAPEQLAGGASSVRSDLYALGLVLYEVFTGHPAFKAGSIPELLRRKSDSTPTNPSDHVAGFDPAVERVILRCLEREPRHRPPSAVAVAAALPGGDPLAAALAAGETPSPELVAEAGEEGGLSPATAIACLACFLLGLVGLVVLGQRVQVTGIVQPEKPPEVLVERSRELVRKAGLSDRPADSTFDYTYDFDYLAYIAEHDKGTTRWDRLANVSPTVLGFWYRQSPRYLAPSFGFVTYWDPPALISGMANVILDHRGRLLGLKLIPPQRDDATGPWPEPDWSFLLEEAGLDAAALKEVPPVWHPEFFVDRRAAWEFTPEDAPDMRIHVEAAAYHGKPAYFEVLAPWDFNRPSRMRERPWSLADKVSGIAALVIAISLVTGACLLARRNFRQGRGDRKGAFRLSVLSMALLSGFFLLETHFVPEGTQVLNFAIELGLALVFFCGCWVFYMALEPYLRKLWPKTIVSWVRLLDGRFRDPLVGRDLLIGLMAGVLLQLRLRLEVVGAGWFGLPPIRPDYMTGWGAELAALRGLRHSLAWLLPTTVIWFCLLIMLWLLLLRLLLRRQWIAGVAFVLLWTLTSPVLSSTWLSIADYALGGFVLLVIALRFGMVSFAGAELARDLVAFPISFDLSRWYAVNALVAGAALAILAGWAFHVSLAGRRPFRSAWLDEERAA